MLHYIFEEFKGEITETMKKIYPDLVEDDEFIGALSTNAIEGGNWRRKNLRNSYSNLETHLLSNKTDKRLMELGKELGENKGKREAQYKISL